MILELTDGRELQLPDEMPDETARMIGKLILRLEKRTQEAEAVVQTLQAEIAPAVVQATPIAYWDVTAVPVQKKKRKRLNNIILLMG